MTFWNFTIFRKTLLDQSLWIFKWASWWCPFPHKFVFISYTEITKISYFNCNNIKLALQPPKINEKIMLTLIYFDMGICFYLYELKIKNFPKFIYDIHEKLWGDDIINSLIWIFVSSGQEMFSEKIWNFKMSYFLLISYPIFIIFAPFCRENFSLSS